MKFFKIDNFFKKHHFLPHKENRTRAKLLSLEVFSFYSFLVLATILVLNTIPPFVPGVLGYASDISINALLKNTNERRIQNNLDELVISEPLSKAAYNKALDMFQEDYWAHISPKGAEPWDFILAQDYDYIYAGENLAKNFSQSKDVVQAWMESPTHKENLLNSNYQEVGFAVVNGTLNGYETTLVVQMFGQPRDQSTIASKSETNNIISRIETYQKSSSVASVSVSDTTTDLIVSNVNNNQTLNNTNRLGSSFLQKYTQNNTVNVNTLFGYAVTLLLGFIIGLLVIDIIYSHKNNIDKISGHTFAHLVFLVITAVSIWLVIDSGIIL